VGLLSKDRRAPVDTAVFDSHRYLPGITNDI
jgi:hypothetical protein